MSLIGSLVVNVSANAAGFAKGMIVARTSLHALQASTSSGVGGMSALTAGMTAMGPVAIAAGAALTGLGIAGALAFKAIAEAASRETMTTRMATLMGSVSDAKAMMKDLQAYADTTPFEMPQVTGMANSLLAANVEANKLIPTIKMLGDVAAGSGGDPNHIAQIYAKVLNKGKLQGEELAQFAENSIPLNRQLAKDLGVTTEQVFKLGEQGKITSAMMTNAFINMRSEGGIYFNATNNLAQTLEGRWSTFKDGIASIFAEVGEALIAGLDIKGAMTNMSDLIAFIKPMILDVVAVFVDNFSFVKDFMGGMVSGMGSEFMVLAQIIAQSFALAATPVWALWKAFQALMVAALEVKAIYQQAKGDAAGAADTHARAFGLQQRLANDFKDGVYAATPMGKTDRMFEDMQKRWADMEAKKKELPMVDKNGELQKTPVDLAKIQESAKGQKKMADEMAKREPTGAALRGSKDAYSAVLQNNRNAKEQDAAKQQVGLAKDQLAQQKEMVRFLRNRDNDALTEVEISV